MSKINYPEPKPEDIILQVGDFGYWPKLHGQIYNGKYSKRIWDQYNINNGSLPIYFAEGNHEDLPVLFNLETNEIQKNIFWMKRGSTLTLPDGRVVMFFGGARSIDRKYRIESESWFPEEVISNEDVENLPDVDVDIMITHTAPIEFVLPMRLHDEIDPSRYMLSEVLKKYHPKHWFCGHFHSFITGFYRGNFQTTEWTCLADICSMQRWFTRL